MSRRQGGVLQLTLNGRQYRAKGNFTHDLGAPKRDAIVGPDGVHGYKEMPKQPFIEGAITDGDDISLEDLYAFQDGTAVLTLANGKSLAFREAWYAGDGQGTTEEGEINLRIEAMRAEEIPA